MEKPIPGPSVRPKYRRNSFAPVHVCRRYAVIVSALGVLLQASGLEAQTHIRKAEAARTYLTQGQAALKANRTGVAVQDFRQALTLDPQNVEANMNLGVIAFLSGDCEAAGPRLKSALAGDRALTKARAFLAICEKRLGEKTARVDLESSFSQLKDPKLRTMVGFELASLDYQRGDLDRTVSVMQTLIKLDPDNIDILYFAQLVYSEMADDTLNKLALLAPNSARMQEVVAERLVNAGNLKGAIDHYRKALAIDGYLPGAHYELAEAILESSPNDAQAQAEALQELRLSIKVDGESAKTESMLGRIALLQDDRGGAAKYYKRALELDPENEDAQMGLAKLLMEENKPQDAMKYLRAVVESDPLNAEAHYRLATVCRTLNLKDQEQQQLRFYQEITKTKDRVKSLYREMNARSTPTDDPQQK